MIVIDPKEEKTLPTEGMIQIPIVISHELMHSEQMENSEICSRLIGLYQENDLIFSMHHPFEHSN